MLRVILYIMKLKASMCVTKGRNHWKNLMLFPRKHCVSDRCIVFSERDRGTKKGRTTTTNQQTFTKRKENLEYF